MDGLKTKELWELSPRELELYLHLLSGSEVDTLGQASRELSEILGETYWKNQVYTSLTNLQDKGLVDSHGFKPTKESFDDILDRLRRFYGRAAHDPSIRTVEDIGDDQRYFRVITNGAERALDSIGTRCRNLDELGTIIMNEWIIGKLDSSDSSAKLTTQQRDIVRALLKLSTAGILGGLSQEDPAYDTVLFKLIFLILSKTMRFVGHYTSAPPL